MLSFFAAVTSFITTTKQDSGSDQLKMQVSMSWLKTKSLIFYIMDYQTLLFSIVLKNLLIHISFQIHPAWFSLAVSSRRELSFFLSFSITLSCLDPPNIFPVLEPKNSSVDKFYAIRKRPSTDFEAITEWKGRSGLPLLPQDTVWLARRHIFRLLLLSARLLNMYYTTARQPC